MSYWFQGWFISLQTGYLWLYSTCVTKKRVKRVLLLTWIIGIATSTITSLTVNFNNFDDALEIISQVVDISYLLFIICSYIAMFLRLKSSGASAGITRTFRESRFFVAFLLVSTFIWGPIIMDIGFLSKLTTKSIFLFIEVIVLNCIIISDSVIYMGMDRETLRSFYVKSSVETEQMQQIQQDVLLFKMQDSLL